MASATLPPVGALPLAQPLAQPGPGGLSLPAALSGSLTSSLTGSLTASSSSAIEAAQAAQAAEVLTELFHANADHYRLSFQAINRMRQHAQVDIKISSFSIFISVCETTFLDFFLTCSTGS